MTDGPPERLALLLPVSVNGIACTVQLDTGANGEWNWRRRDAAAKGERAQVNVAGRRRAIPANAANLAPLKEANCGGGPIAMVGNALFENGTLTLDLGQARYAYTEQPLLAGVHDAQPLLYLSWAEGGGHTVVEIRHAGTGLGYALLDTGAARFGLVASDDRMWQALIAGAKPSAGTSTFSFPGPGGETVSCGERPLEDGLEVAGKTLRNVSASYCQGHSFQAPMRLIGTLGMAALGNRTLVLDYLSRRWTLSD
ncbi:hypothetical protein [Duganella sacchari]|uniref:hypothetical protein n=1 Tax=Duganella sacchari TaxID=551987 RepID=UPI000933DDBF|nr:hypothetical protein [Duganella sacchari]